MAVIGLATVSCVPEMAGYVILPIASEDRVARPDAVVDVTLIELAPHFDDFDAKRIGFYFTGRAPIAYELVDNNRNGQADTARLAVSIAAGAGTDLVVVCPGALRTEPANPLGEPTPGVVPQYRRIRR